MASNNSDWMKEFIRQSFRFVDRLSKSVRLSLTAVVILTIFWFLSVYLVGNGFYASNPVVITLLFSFAAAVVWLIMNVAITSAGFVTFETLAEKFGINWNTDADEEVLIIGGGMNSIVYMSGILLLTYYFHFSFLSFLLLCSGYAVVSLLYILIFLLALKLTR
jgi:hypothetical protein